MRPVTGCFAARLLRNRACSEFEAFETLRPTSRSPPQPHAILSTGGFVHMSHAAGTANLALHTEPVRKHAELVKSCNVCSCLLAKIAQVCLLAPKKLKKKFPARCACHGLSNQLTRITHFRFIAISSNWALRRILTFAAPCYSNRHCARLSRCTERRFCLRIVAVMGCLLECTRRTLASRLLCAMRRPFIDQSETQPAAGSTATSQL